MAATDSRFRAVVFDMGGVLVELGPLTEILGEDPLSVNTFWEKWLASPAVRDFEMGLCSADVFGERLVLELGLSFDGPELVRRFRSWPKGLFLGAEQLVRDLSGDLAVGVLSNTNALHWDHQRDHERVKALFSRCYLSYELGLVKPDREIFEHIVADLGLVPGEILFLDDNQINVDAARAVGIEAMLARGVADARAALSVHNLVD